MEKLSDGETIYQRGRKNICNPFYLICKLGFSLGKQDRSSTISPQLAKDSEKFVGGIPGNQSTEK